MGTRILFWGRLFKMLTVVNSSLIFVKIFIFDFRIVTETMHVNQEISNEITGGLGS
uniref:Uncharacterized protein LOC104222885 n=1 Tax=Nicotiana sylvestris TaxID=4096 RepID=A0A1U7WCY6_NICSY|nr:PREDICTED: uncharacterized protein LOC104222885 [Nicotiana sylvestris]